MFEWPPWLVLAQAEECLNVREIHGPIHNERILMYHDETGLDASSDEVPWCSSFVNYCVRRCGMGLKGSFSARARSWLRTGTILNIPATGCIVVLKRYLGDSGPDVIEAQGHVGFFVGQPNSKVVSVLGGNQSNRVQVSEYPVAKLLGYRWPIKPSVIE